MSEIAFLIGFVLGTTIQLLISAVLILEQRQEYRRRIEEISREMYKEYEAYERRKNLSDRFK